VRIALTGVSGFIGSTTARHLAAAGHHVTGLVRATSRRDHIEDVVDRFVVGDHADDTCWPDLLDGADAVIHNSVDWAPLRGVDFDRHLQTNLVGSLRLLRASEPRPFVFISSVAVHHDIRDRWQGVIDEEHPTRPAGDYGAYKAAVEPHLWRDFNRSGRHTVAIRPCQVYGIEPSVDSSIGFDIVQQLRRGESFDRAGGGKFVHVEDVARTIVAAATNEAAAGRAIDVTDCYARWGDWATMARDLLGVDVDVTLTGPESSKNVFSKAAATSLADAPGFLQRGHDGIREHLRTLIDATA
jgi:nucleoside-diphosphate-sugar epimerase